MSKGKGAYNIAHEDREAVWRQRKVEGRLRKVMDDMTLSSATMSFFDHHFSYLKCTFTTVTGWCLCVAMDHNDLSAVS